MNYEASVTDVDNVTKVLTVCIPKSEIEASFEKHIGSYSSRVKMKGFRQGKAPRDMVVKQHGEEVRREVIQKLISTSLDNLIKEHEINYVGHPRLDIESNGEEGKDLKFKANFALYPVAELKNYESFSIKLPKIEVSKEEIDRVIGRIQNSTAEYKAITDRTKIQNGDVVQTIIQAIVDDVSNGDGTPMRMEVGGPDVPEEITEALVTMSVGEVKTVAVKSITEDERNKGKRVEYKITASELFEKILPEMTDAFAKQVDTEVETVLELRKKIDELLQKDKEEQSRLKAEGLVLKDLANRHDFQIPQLMIDMEIYNMLVRGNMIDPQQMPFDRFNGQPFRERMGGPAEERVKAAVLVDKIGEADKLLPNEEETKQWFSEQKARLGEEAFKQFLKEQNSVQSAWVDYTRRKVLDFLLSRTKIEYITQEEFDALEAKEQEAKKDKKTSKKEKKDKEK